MSQVSYLVRRPLEGNGSALYYVITFKPEHGETYYKGAFRPREMRYGQFRDKTTTVYDPNGAVTTHQYDDGKTETITKESGVFMVRRELERGCWYYVKTTKPAHADEIFFGAFRAKVAQYGFPVKTANVCEPVGEPTCERYDDGATVTF